MNVRIEVRVEGIPEVVAWLEGPFKKEAQKASDVAADQVLDDAKKHAKRSVPVDTGALKRSIRKEGYARPAGFFTYKGLRAGGYVRNPKTGRLVDYAKYVEYGTSLMYPRPFIRPAVRRSIKKFPTYFYRELGRRVKLE